MPIWPLVAFLLLVPLAFLHRLRAVIVRYLRVCFFLLCVVGLKSVPFNLLLLLSWFRFYGCVLFSLIWSIVGLDQMLDMFFCHMMVYCCVDCLYDFDMSMIRYDMVDFDILFVSICL